MALTPMTWDGDQYSVFELPHVTTTRGGIYIFTAWTGTGWAPLYIGEADNIRHRLSNHERADDINRERPTHIHILEYEEDRQRRKAQEQRLIGMYHPKLNRQHGASL